MLPIIPPDGSLFHRRHIHIMSAMTEGNRCIGRNGKLLFYLPLDLENFKKRTLNKIVVVGNTTNQSIIAKLGSPLPDRETIVLTRNRNIVLPEGCKACFSREQVLELTKGKDIYIIGGQQIYELFMGDSDRMELTWIEAKVLDGDTFFPEIPCDYKTYGTKHFQADGKKPAFRIVKYKRRPRLVE